MKTMVPAMLAVSALAITAILALPAGVAQVPAGAPAGTTGLCNDGSYWTGPSKSGACSGHKGVKTWYAAAAAPAGLAAPGGAMMAANPKSSTPSSATKTVAPGGGPGLVWLNTSTQVYHCFGTKFYGTTKAGSYMSEAAAKAKGAHANGGKPCS